MEYTYTRLLAPSNSHIKVNDNHYAIIMLFNDSDYEIYRSGLKTILQVGFFAKFPAQIKIVEHQILKVGKWWYRNNLPG
ncbi:hypothetical protein B4900_04580 [Yersinia rohdei]|nr:hypothetical protein B4900_04580 [Yersinia rohdei]